MKMNLHTKTILSSAILLMIATIHSSQAQPTLSPPVLSNDLVHAQLTLSNCTNTTILYTVQTSPDLVNWTNLQTNFAAFTNVLITVPVTNPQAFYQLVTNPAPIFQAALITVSNIAFKGNSVTVDSFDSSNPLYSTVGLYDINKRKANANVATASTNLGSVSVQNGIIYGTVVTGPGSIISAVNVGALGSVGDANWVQSHVGIESNHWSGGFNPTIPDVVPPAASASLPAPDTNGIIQLSSGAYLATNDPGMQIHIDGPVALWVASSYSPNITFSSNNPYASLALYVGSTNFPGTNSLILGAHGDMNYPGYARNLQIYGLPGLASIGFLFGNAICTVYAPEATVSAGGGAGPTTTSGAIIANQILANGHWNFHYDESLVTNGPTF